MQVADDILAHSNRVNHVNPINNPSLVNSLSIPAISIIEILTWKLHL
jgi:hypothetical protein